jgi:hypothetical protein
MNNIHLYISLIISLTILSLIIYWLNKIDTCLCASKIPEKKYLKEWFVFKIIIIIIIYIYAIFIVNNNNFDGLSKSTLNIIIGIYIIFVIISAVMLIRLFIYIRKMRELKCNCGMLKFQNFIYYYLIVAFSFIAFTLLILIIYGIFMASNYTKKNKKLR